MEVRQRRTLPMKMPSNKKKSRTTIILSRRRDRLERRKNKDSESLVDLDAKKIKKTMKSILRKAPNRTMKSKKLRKDILKTLALKKAFEKKVEGIMTKHVESNPKKLVFSGDGKKVTLLKKDK